MPHVKVAFGDPLTDRELQVLARVAEGAKDSRIGSDLGLTVATIATYRKRVRIKLGAKCAAHAVALGFIRGHLPIPRRGVS